MVGTGQKKRINFRWLLIFAFAVSLVGCKTARKAEAVFVEGENNVVLLNKIKEATPWFHSMDIKRANLAVRMNGNNYNSPASCKLIRDSVIHLSITPFFGVEMFIVRITRQDILVVDKMRNVFYQSDYRSLQNYLGFRLDFQTLQAVFTNTAFIVGEYEISPDMFRQKRMNETVIMHSARSGLTQETTLTDNFRVSKTEIANQSARFEASYQDFKTQDDVLFPFGVNFSFNAGNSALSIQMNINRIGFNEQFNIPAIQLNNYRRGSIEQLMR